MSHVDFSQIREFLLTGAYPDGFEDRGKRANFRRATRNVVVKESAMVFLRHNKYGTEDELQVIFTQDEAKNIIIEVHEGKGNTAESRALRGHHGIRATISIITKRFYWRTIQKDVQDYVKKCDACQKTNQTFSKAAPELHPVGITQKCMSQIGVDISCLPESQGFRYMILAVDYFSKWCEGKPLQSKTAVDVGKFLYELICRHGCFDVQINDQGREFVNQIAAELHRLTGVEQRITSAYHPQANGLVERQNRTIKEKLLKVLEGSHDDWVSALDGVLFAHRSTVHRSTGFSPFYLMYGRDPKLPVDVALRVGSKGKADSCSVDDDYDLSVEQIADATNHLRRVAVAKAGANIEKAQVQQKADYDRRHRSKYRFKEGDKVLLRNLKRRDRKGGKSSYPWKGPYMIGQLFENSTCSLIRPDGPELSQKQHTCNIKPYLSATDAEDGFQLVPCSNAAVTAVTVLEVWLPDMRFSCYDRFLISSGDWLDDKIIDAAQTLLAKQYSIGGLQTSLLSQVEHGFPEPQHPSLQIHHDTQRTHWVTSTSCRRRVEIADSLNKGRLSQSLKQQLQQCYSSLRTEEGMYVYMLDVQSQDNGSDCGVFAIAYATEFLVDGGNPLANFDVGAMRPHLVSCLEQGVMYPFPKTYRVGCKRSKFAVCKIGGHYGE